MGLLVCFLIVYGVALDVIDRALGGVSLEHPGVKGALALSAAQLVLIAVAFGLMSSGASSVRGAGLLEPAHRSVSGIRALAPAGLLVLVPTFVYALAVGDGLLAPHLTLTKVAAFALLALLIGVNEELWFRGMIIDVLGGPRRPWLAVIVSTLLFGLPHIGPGATGATVLNALGVTLAVGIPFAVVRLRYRALVPMIAWHAVIDAWAFVHTSSVVAQGNPSTTDVLAGLLLPGFIALGYVAWYAAARRRELDAPA